MECYIMKVVNQNKIDRLLANQKNKFVSIVYTAKDGHTRKINAHLRVKKYLKNTGRINARYDNDIITVFDMQKMAYRSLKISGIRGVIASGFTYFVS